MPKAMASTTDGSPPADCCQCARGNRLLGSWDALDVTVQHHTDVLPDTVRVGVVGAVEAASEMEQVHPTHATASCCPWRMAARPDMQVLIDAVRTDPELRKALLQALIGEA